MHASVNDSISPELASLTFSQIQALDREATNGETFAYYESSQVSRATVYRNRISGIVGNFVEQFQVQITVHQQEISGYCSCGKSLHICKHVVALLYSWVNDGGDFLNVEHALSEIREMDRDRLIEVVSNIIRHDPQYLDLFFAKNKEEWDEIDPDPFL